VSELQRRAAQAKDFKVAGNANYFRVFGNFSFWQISSPMAEAAVLSAGVSAAAQRVFSLVQNISTIADTVESNKKQSESLARYVLLLNLPLQRRASSSPEACQLVIYELNKIAEFLKQFEPTQSRIKKLLLWKNSTAHQSSLS
jgi:hypothetical protein